MKLKKGDLTTLAAIKTLCSMKHNSSISHIEMMHFEIKQASANRLYTEGLLERSVYGSYMISQFGLDTLEDVMHGTPEKRIIDTAALYMYQNPHLKLNNTDAHIAVESITHTLGKRVERWYIELIEEDLEKLLDKVVSRIKYM